MQSSDEHRFYCDTTAGAASMHVPSTDEWTSSYTCNSAPSLIRSRDCLATSIQLCMRCADGSGYTTAVAKAMATAFASGNGQAVAKATATAIATYGCPAVQTVIARKCP